MFAPYGLYSRVPPAVFDIVVAISPDSLVACVFRRAFLPALRVLFSYPTAYRVSLLCFFVRFPLVLGIQNRISLPSSPGVAL